MVEREIYEKSIDPVHEPASTPTGHGLAIRRSGSAVQITLTAGNEYLAMELFDRLVKSAQEGALRLDINASANGTNG